MMNKAKLPVLKLAKYFFVLPLVFLLIFANSCMNRDNKDNREVSIEDNVVVTDTIELFGEDTSQGEMDVNGDEVFVVVEEQPEFPGGHPALMKFLSDNIRYPDHGDIQGRVICNFIVEKDGSLSDFRVVRGVHPSMDKEALRVLQAMPNWKPGKQNGKEVRVRFTVPVVFRLQH